MLLRQTGETIFAIPQPAHAWLSGVMAQAWGNTAFAPPRPYREVCLAAALHDVAWLNWELRPEFDARTGRPRVFADVPAETHTALWREGVAHVELYSLYAAVLVSMHGDTIYDKTFDARTARPQAVAAVNAFRNEQRRFQHQAGVALRADAAIGADASAERLACNKRLVAAVDTLSLHACWGVNETTTVDDVPTSDTAATDLTLRPGGDGVIVVDPWPFDAPRVELAVQGRRLSGRFADAEDMADAMRRTTPTVLGIVLQPS